MNQDLALTATGTPAIVVGKERYPLCWTIAGMKEWSEHSGQSFEALLTTGWNLTDLTEADWRKMLMIVMKGGEARRALFDGAPRTITGEMVDHVFSLIHPTELITILSNIWVEPPVREGDEKKPKE